MRVLIRSYLDQPCFLPVKFIAHPFMIYVDFLILIVIYWNFPKSSNVELLQHFTKQWDQSPIVDIVDSKNNNTYQNLNEISKWIYTDLSHLFNSDFSQKHHDI